jgi:hypothetical protein
MNIQVYAKLDTRGFDRLLRNGPANNERATRRLAEELRDDIREHWSGLYPPASSPGEPPAKRSGKLDRSVRARPGRAHWIARAKVVIEVGYGKFLENGTQRMAERPFMRPAIQRLRKNAKKHYAILFNR